MEDAGADYQALGSEGSAPSYTPHEDPGSEEGIKQRNDYLSALQAFQAEQAKREEAARVAADRLEDRLNQAADVMAGLHDQPRGGDEGPGDGSYPSGSASGGAGSAGTRSGTTGSVFSIGAHATFDEHGTGDGGRGGVGRDPDGPRVDYVPGSPHPNAGGTPASVSASGGPINEVVSGSDGGLTIGPAGVVAGGAAAGVIGARLSGALRGVLAGGAGPAGAAGAAGAAGRSGTAAGAVRGIGATAQSAGASTLGRGAAAGARPGAAAPGAAGRSGAAGARGAGAGSGTGRAGSRAGAAGAGAGRGGRRGTDDDGRDHETFDVGEDWVGDDDAGPGVLS